MAHVVGNLRPLPPPLTATRTGNRHRIDCIAFRGNNSLQLQLQLKLNSKPTTRVYAFFSNNNKQDQARQALENALGGKKNEFEKWNKEIQKREEMGGGDGSGSGGGWFGWRRWFGDGDHFWEEAQQASLVVLVLLFVYLVIAKGETLLAVVFNPMLFALRGVRNGFTYITSNISKRISPDAAVQPLEELPAHLSAKEKVIKKWASD